MSRVRRLGPSLPALALLALGSAQPAAAAEWRCDDFAELSAGELVLSNNVWNRGATRDYEQCIALEAGPDPAFRWRWRWPGGDAMPEAFPEVVFGWQPWRSASTTPRLPRRLRDLARLRAHYSAEVTARGVHNLAFQLWLVEGAAVSASGVRAEVMLWIANAGMTPAGPRTGTIEVGSRPFDVHHERRRHDDRGVERRWELFTLVAREPQLTGPIDLAAGLRALVATGALRDDLWLANVDLGTEVAEGSGEARVRGLRIDVE